MTSHEMLLEQADLYALDALEADEVREFEYHLQSCPTCQQELASAQAAVAALVPDQTAPTHLWPAIAASLDDVDEEVVVEFRARPGRRTGLQAVTAVAAGAALVVAGVLVGSARSDDGTSSIADAASKAADAPGSTSVALGAQGSVVAEVVISEDGLGYLIPTESLPALEESRTYQLWVVNGEGAVISAGVFGSDPPPSLFTWTGDITGIALTREVAGGVTVSDGDVVAAVTDI